MQGRTLPMTCRSAISLLIRQENSDIAFPPFSAKGAEKDGAPGRGNSGECLISPGKTRNLAKPCPGLIKFLLAAFRFPPGKYLLDE